MTYASRLVASACTKVAVRTLETAAAWIESHPTEDPAKHLRESAARLRRARPW